MTAIVEPLASVGAAITRRLDRLTERRFALLLFLPAAVIVVGILLPPMMAVFGMSFFRIELVRDANTPFVGLDNYLRIFRDADFLASVPRTIVLGAAVTVLTVPLALFTATLLNRAFRGAALLGVAVLLPWSIAPVVTGQFWQFIFHSHFGVLTGIATALGLTDGPIRWLEDTRLALSVAVAAASWRIMPLLALIFLAALKTIPSTLYRAGRMDGATTWQLFRHITLPGIRSTLLVVTILSIIMSLQIFDILFALTGGGPGRDTTVIPYYIYLRAFQNLSLGYAAALAVVLFLIVVSFSVVLILARFRDRPVAEAESNDADNFRVRRTRLIRPIHTGDWAASRRGLTVPSWLGRACQRFAIAALLIWLLAPIVWILVASVQTEQAVTQAPPQLSLLPTFEQYGFLLGHDKWMGSMAVSLQVAVLTMGITIVLGSVAAYPLARLDLPRKGAVMGIMVITQMIPAVAMAIPVLLLFQALHLRDTVAGLVLINVAFLLPLVIWLLRNYIAEVPRSIEAAARIDGCSRIGTLFRVTIPAAAPGIAAVAILILIGTWNEFLFAVVLGDREAVTVTRRITDLQSLSVAYGVIYTERAAAGVLAVLPPLVLVFLFHRRIVGGITQGFPKG